MREWSKRRKASFAVHAGFLAVPFLASTASAWMLWYTLFGQTWQAGAFATAMVLTVDALAFAGLVLYIARIDSPFQPLRHVIPLVSVVPLGIELYALLSGVDGWIRGGVAGLVTLIFVVVAHYCLVTIERLFIDPVQAAQERASEDARALGILLAVARVQRETITASVREYLDAATPPVVTSAPPPDMSPDTMTLTGDSDTDTSDSGAATRDMSMVARQYATIEEVKQALMAGDITPQQAAALTGKAERTMFRWKQGASA